MPGPIIRNPTPQWMRPENASVLDGPFTKLVRGAATLVGINDPKTAILGMMAPMEPGAAGLEGIVQKWLSSGVKLEAYESAARPGTVTLAKIVVPAEARNQGIGTAVMRDLAGYADQSGKKIALTPDTSFGGSSVSRLRSFYKRFDFQDNAGRTKDYGISEAMVRHPK